MAEGGESSGLKRPFDGEDDGYGEEKSSRERKIRFPKGKKARKGDEVSAGGNGGDGAAEFGRLVNPELAVMERAKRRNQNREDELFKENVPGMEDIWAAEVNYEGNTGFEDDGIRIEPFNLKQEREEGYFDSEGNYVEFVAEKEIKDAWLENVQADPSLAEKLPQPTANEEFDDLSSDDIGKIKRRIADALQPRETVLSALKRLKGSTGGRKEKMPEQIKCVFDQLTEDAMKLMEGGEYDVYYEKKETFKREAEGYERLVNAREGTSQSSGIINPNPASVGDLFSDAEQANETTINASANDDDTFDMFGDEDEDKDTDKNPQSDALSPHQPPETSGSGKDAGEGNGTDFVFDESSGYYYSSSLGYYYDPSSQLYCCASSGKWYSFDEETGEYKEVEADLQNQAGDETAMDST